MKKILESIKCNWLFTILLIIFIILNIMTFINLGYDYSINSDDLSYINSGITFYETGKITMHGVVSAQIMPGLTFIIAFFCLIFGTGSVLLITLKIFYILMSILTMIVLYKTARIFANKYISTFVCLFLLVPDYLWMNNLILTETPFMLLLLLLIYHSLKFIKEHKNKDYVLIIIYYIICLFIRPTIALLPIILILCLLIKKYNLKDLIKKTIIAAIAVLVFLTPWIIRNYQVFDKFIPLTYGMGNPLLLGTYQGENYPKDEDLDYKINVDDKMSSDMKKYLDSKYPRDKFKVYYSLEYDKMKAEYRMHYWWQEDKISMLKTYLIDKPKIMLFSSFYWEELFNIDIKVNLLFRAIDLVLFFISSIIIILRRKYLVPFLFLILLYGYHIALYSYSFAYERYAITLFPIRFIIIAMGISLVCDAIKKIKPKINDVASQHK